VSQKSPPVFAFQRPATEFFGPGSATRVLEEAKA
jgi:hypothetical protein